MTTTAAPTTASAAPLIDLAALRLLVCEIGEAGAETYLTHFRDGLARRLDRLRDALRPGQTAHALELARNLATAGTMAGAHALAQAADALADSLRSGATCADTALADLASLVWATTTALDEILPDAPRRAVAG